MIKHKLSFCALMMSMHIIVSFSQYYLRICFYINVLLLILQYITCLENNQIIHILNANVTENQKTLHKLNIVIHIGPHKTGSTYIQNALLTLNEVLASYNYIQPYEKRIGHVHAKMNSLFVNELFNLKAASRHHKINKMQSFFMNAFKKHHNVLFSSEDLSQVTSDGLDIFGNMIEHFHPKIIIIFRDSLSRTLSNYKHTFDITSLSDDSYVPDFLSYVNEMLNTSIKNYYPTIIEKFSSHFGIENLVMIDYDGAKAAKKDLVYIILCEINKLLCDELSNGLKSFYEKRKLKPYTEANKAEDHKSLIISGVFSEVRKYINNNNCSIPIISHKTMDEVISNELQLYKVLHNLEIPSQYISSLQIRSLHDKIIRYDDELRTKYKANILYSNRNASISAVQRLVISELNKKLFLKSKLWQNFIEQIFKILEQRLLLDCMKINLPYYRRAVIHIGPEYTGSFYLQNVLYNMKDFWKKRRFSVPNTHTPQEMDGFAQELLEYGKIIKEGNNLNEIYKMKLFIKNALNNEEKIVFSTDKLSLISPPDILMLKRMFQNFDTKIVIVFRDSLTIAYTKYLSIIHHKGINKLNPNMKHFREFLNTIDYKNFYLNLIQSYATTFGIENIMIMDYYGIEMVQSDLAEVFFCKTGRIDLFRFNGKICGDIVSSFKSNKLMISNNHIEKRVDENFLIYNTLTSEIFTAIKLLNCKLSRNKFFPIKTEIIKYVQDRNFTTKPLPIYDINFQVMHKNTIQYDDEVRRLYGNITLYNNRLANIAAVVSLNMQDLNSEQFLKGLYWIEWKEKVLRKLLQNNIIHYCKAIQSSQYDRNRTML